VTIAILRAGLSAKRSPSPETIRSARSLTASSRNLSSVGSRHAIIRSVIVTSSATAISFLNQACASGGNVRPGNDFEELFFGRERFEQPAAPLDHERRHSRHGLLFERGADKNIGIENDPLQHAAARLPSVLA
jgi:hypothetical protein